MDIEYLPYQKIIVHEVRKLELSDLLNMVVAQVEAQKQGGVPGINWVDGVAFVFSEFMPSPETIAEQLKGRIHYQMVWYAETSYQNEKRVTVNGRDYGIRLMKAGDNPNFVDLVKFLKSFEQ